MKEFRTFLLVFIALVFALNAESQKSDSKDKIKSLIVMEEKPNSLIKKQYKESETYYDSHGNVIEEIKYKEGKITKHFKYVYDANDNKIKEEEFDSSGDLIESSTYRYENGLRVEKIVYDEDSRIKTRKTYLYTTY
jgi:antitoxin component YwqK of YwqJK toxin-antitoxin module